MDITLKVIIDDLEKDIKAKESDLIADKNALRRLKERYLTQEIGAGKNNLFPNYGKPQRVSLMSDVKSVLLSFGAYEFTVASIEDALHAEGKYKDTDNLRGKISTAMTKLANDKAVIRTYTGGGADPHRYIINNNGKFQ